MIQYTIKYFPLLVNLLCILQYSRLGIDLISVLLTLKASKLQHEIHAREFHLENLGK